jgi:hypothetical protein
MSQKPVSSPAVVAVPPPVAVPELPVLALPDPVPLPVVAVAVPELALPLPLVPEPLVPEPDALVEPLMPVALPEPLDMLPPDIVAVFDMLPPLVPEALPVAESVPPPPVAPVPSPLHAATAAEITSQPACVRSPAAHRRTGTDASWKAARDTGRRRVGDMDGLLRSGGS